MVGSGHMDRLAGYRPSALDRDRARDLSRGRGRRNHHGSCAGHGAAGDGLQGICLIWAANLLRIELRHSGRPPPADGRCHPSSDGPCVLGGGGRQPSVDAPSTLAEMRASHASLSHGGARCTADALDCRAAACQCPIDLPHAPISGRCRQAAVLSAIGPQLQAVTQHRGLAPTARLCQVLARRCAGSCVREGAVCLTAGTAARHGAPRHSSGSSVLCASRQAVGDASAT
jgi:hypothetical protein